MDIDIAYPHGRRLEVVETGRRRRWRPEVKARIVEESFQPGVSASSVARRHGIAPSHLFLWRRAYLEGVTRAPAGFAPVVVDEAAGVMASDGGRMEVIVGERRIVVGPDFDATALARLIQTLERA